jgi:transmembrane sensor
VTSVDDVELTRLEEAAHWLERLESGRGSEEAFERWRSDPANARAFVKVSATSQWISQNLPKTLSKAPSPKSKGVTRRWWLSGAAAAVTVVAGGYLALGLTTGRAEAMTAVGERSSLSLPDGGRIDINTDSKVRWHFGKQMRQIWLDRGEISVSVQADQRDFVVRAGKEEITLAPGQYNLRLKETGVEMAVERGEGRVTSKITPVQNIVRAGEISSVSDHQAHRVTSANPETFEVLTAWKNDEIVLDGVTLAAAVSEYNRYLTQKITIADPHIGSIRIGGRFTTKDPTIFITSLRSSFGIRAERGKDGSISLRS